MSCIEQSIEDVKKRMRLHGTSKGEYITVSMSFQFLAGKKTMSNKIFLAVKKTTLNKKETMIAGKTIFKCTCNHSIFSPL